MEDLTITRALVIPSYGEDLALPDLLETLAGSLSKEDVIIVADDSKPDIRTRLVAGCHTATKNSPGLIRFTFAESKSGRGSAVRRGMELARREYPNLEYVLECDADGSHQARDIVRVRDSSINCDLLVGSRYLKDSQIIGWPIARRIFSKLLNALIPRVLDLPMKDVTNGLRRYSIEAVDLVLSKDANSKGFIYLSEQALLISRSGLRIAEIPIIFIDRELGTSTVTWREISSSIFGIFRLILLNSGSNLKRNVKRNL